MGRQALAVGTHGAFDVTRQKRDADGRWKALPTKKGTAERWRARCYYRGHDGMTGELSRVAGTRAEAEASLRAALDEKLSVGHVDMTAGMPFVEAGRVWLAQIARTDSRLSERTILDYGRTFARYIDVPGSSVRGLTLVQANDPQRLRRFLQEVADQRGTASSKITRSVLMGILSLAVDNGTLTTDALRQVRPVEAHKVEPAIEGKVARDTTRALRKEERDAIVAHADDLAAAEGLAPQTRRKRQATADLLAFMAGTGVRVGEARALRWEDVDLDSGVARIHGTKSRTSRRGVTLPPWLAERLLRRADTVGASGYVFASPHHLDGGRQWDQSNSAKALAAVIAGAGFPWATPHTFRRSVATIAHNQGAPLAAIADQLGHADPSMTARVYLGRDPFGDRSSVAQFL